MVVHKCFNLQCFLSDASNEPVESGDADADDDVDGITNVLGTSLSVGQHAFSRMEVDVDKRRKERKREDSRDVSVQQRLQ